MNTTAIDERTVKELARKLWEKAGHPVGGPEKYRLEAARLLSVGQQTRKNQTADEAARNRFPRATRPRAACPTSLPSTRMRSGTRRQSRVPAASAGAALLFDVAAVVLLQFLSGTRRVRVVMNDSEVAGGGSGVCD